MKELAKCASDNSLQVERRYMRMSKPQALALDSYLRTQATTNAFSLQYEVREYFDETEVHLFHGRIEVGEVHKRERGPWKTYHNGLREDHQTPLDGVMYLVNRYLEIYMRV